MAISPGANIGDTTVIGGVEYEWDGEKWNMVPSGIVGTLDTSEIALANPTRAKFDAIEQGVDLYPDTTGLTTQEDANNILVEITDWLRLHKSEVIIQSGLPDHTLYNDGALWVDTDTYDMFVLTGTQWIDLTALPDMTDYVKDTDMAFALSLYLRKQDAIDTYYPVERLLHFIKPNGSFRLHLGDGAELDNIFTRLIEAERGIIHLQDQIDNLGGDGELPPDTAHPGGQYILSGGLSGAVAAGYWAYAYNGIQSWDQITTFYISETDLDGDNIQWTNHIGEFIQVHRYKGNPNTDADFTCSAVYKINSVNDLGTYNTLNVVLQAGTDQGVLGVGEYFTFEIIEEGTI